MKFFSKEHLEKIIQYLLYAVLVTPAIVAGSFLFPYISARTIYFRGLIEIAIIAALLLLIKNKIKFDNNKNYFFYIFSFFVISNIISSFFSFSIATAWFSDIERMWGIFTLLHLFLLYFLLRAFFSGREWKIFLNISVIISLYIAGYGLAQYYPDFFGFEVFQAGAGRIISTLGNSAYVAIYTLFNSFFALFLLLKTKNKWLKFYYAAAVVLNLYAFNLATIRGATMGLLAGFTVAILLYILLGKNKKAKYSVAAVLVITAVSLFLISQNPGSKYVPNNLLVKKITSISLSGGTIETRMIGWRAAWRGFKDYPLFGVGMDNYNTVFNKYFDSDYYLYAPTEPYFDRSHNAILDVLVMNGLVGFIIFLGFPFFIFYYLIKGYQASKIKLDEFLLFTALTIAYFTHLIFVFDDLNSYIYYIVMLAFIEYRYYKNKMLKIEDNEKIAAEKTPLVAIGILMVVIIGYNFNVKVAQACRTTIEALKNGNNLELAINKFNEAVGYEAATSRNVTLSYVNYITGLGRNLQAILDNPAQAPFLKEGVKKASEALDREIKRDSHNSMLYNRQAVMEMVASVVYQNPQHIQSSFEASRKAIELSPEHLQYYYTLADTYAMAGQTEQGIKAIKKSIEINGEYGAGHYNLARFYFLIANYEQALAALKDSAKYKYNSEDFSFQQSLAVKFEERGDYASASEALNTILETNPHHVKILMSLARLYLITGQNDKAVDAIKKITIGTPDLDEQVDYLVKQIEQGKAKEVLGQMNK